MAFRLSSIAQKREESRLKQELSEFEINRRRLRGQIVRDVQNGVKQAISVAKRRDHHEYRVEREVILVHHWEHNSVTRIVDYNKIDKGNRISKIRENEIRADINLFEATVCKLNDTYSEWNIEARYADKAKTIPNRIEVWKK